MSSVSSTTSATNSLAFSVASPTGLDINTLISELTQAENTQVSGLQSQITTIQQQESDYSSIQANVNTLTTSLQTFTDANLSTSSNLFLGKTSTSTNSSAVTATTTNDATLGSYSVVVNNLATSTQANSTAGIGQLTTSSSELNTVAGGAVTSGNFTMYVNNKAYTITVTPSSQAMSDVLNSIVSQINTATNNTLTGVSASIVSGKIQINTGGANISFGANGDTSNAAQILGLSTGSTSSNTFTAGVATSVINQTATLTDNSANLNSTITAGTVTIGGAQFTINSTTSLSGLLGQINSSSTAGVIATYNANTNKIQLVSQSTGQQAITLGSSSDTSNALQVLNLVSSGGDSLTSQTLGQNASLNINNGPTIYSTSNTVGTNLTGLSGVTLTLGGTTESGTPATLTVSQNTAPIITALNTFITAYNALNSDITTATQVGGNEQNDTTLTDLLSSFVSQAAAGYSSASVYTSLAAIGISTGAAGETVTAGSAPNQSLSLNQTAFLAALQSNPTDVQNLLLGTQSNPGVFQTMLNTAQSATDPTYGIFVSEENAATAQIQSINSSISLAQEQLSAKTTQLQEEFTNMNTLVSQYNSQKTAISSLSRSLTSVN